MTRSIHVAVTSSGETLPGTLKFTSTSTNSRQRTALGGGEITIRDVTAAQTEFLMDQTYSVPSLTADYELILDPSAAQPGSATTNLTLTLVVN